jgi:predicted transcriptional regulator
LKKTTDVATRNQNIISQYGTGRTLDSIAEEIGLTRERVRQILSANGVERRIGGRRAELDQENILKVVLEAGSASAAAKQLGISAYLIRKVLKETGTKSPWRRRVDYEDVRDRYLNGETLSAIAKSYNTRPQYINSILRRIGVPAVRAPRSTKA